MCQLLRKRLHPVQNVEVQNIVRLQIFSGRLWRVSEDIALDLAAPVITVDFYNTFGA